MKKIYFLTITLIALITLQSYEYPEKMPNPGKKIGTIKNGQYIITVDTLALKTYWENIINKPSVKLNKIEILKGEVVGRKNEDYYMLIGHIKTQNARATRWLVKEGNDFYFHKMSDEMADDENFYCTYYYITCKDNTSTMPMVLSYG